MESLGRHYHGYTRLWATLLVLGSYFVINRVAPHLTGWLSLFLVKAALSIGVLSTVYWAGETFIRRASWKSTPFLHRLGYHGHDAINFHGKWYGETLYEKVEQADPQAPVNVPFSTTHDVRISQDCLSVKVENTAGDNFPSWGSVAATVDQDGVLRFLYVVSYNDPKRFKSRLFGYEWLSPYRKIPEDVGLPVMILGRFGHTVGEHIPTYSGATLFIRHGHARKLTVEDLPESFRTGKLALRLRAGELR